MSSATGSRIDCSSLTFPFADRLRRERRRRLHQRQGEDLEYVVLQDVAHRTGLLVEAAPAAYAEGLGDGDLHVVDPSAVPDRLEDRVGEPQGQHILDGVLGQVVVDAEDLRPVEAGVHLVVEPEGGAFVAPVRLLDDHAGEALRLCPVQAGPGQPVDHLRERLRRGDQVEHPPAPGAQALVQLREQVAQPHVHLRVAPATATRGSGRPGTGRGVRRPNQGHLPGSPLPA
jgi:hypothetical protein